MKMFTDKKKQKKNPVVPEFPHFLPDWTEFD
jgi:hypothetical protein